MALRAHTESLYQTLQSWFIPHNSQEIQAAIERELRYLIPTWSEHKPTCPGRYWYKPQGAADPQLILVDHGRIDTKLMADLGPPNNLVDVQRVSGQWAGPLLPPQSS